MKDLAAAPRDASRSRLDDDPKETGFGEDADQPDENAAQESRGDNGPKEAGVSILTP